MIYENDINKTFVEFQNITCDPLKENLSKSSVHFILSLRDNS